MNQLNDVYENNQYPTKEFIVYLANDLNLTIDQVSSWFEDMREKEPDQEIKLEFLNS